jgi:hypothetical protein
MEGPMLCGGVILSMQARHRVFLVFMLAAASASTWKTVAPLVGGQEPRRSRWTIAGYVFRTERQRTGLAVECSCSASVPAKDWQICRGPIGGVRCAYSLTDRVESNRWTGRARLRQFPAQPCGEAVTPWATFHFGADGKLIAGSNGSSRRRTRTPSRGVEKWRSGMAFRPMSSRISEGQ